VENITNYIIDVIYVDFQKAFHNVAHRRLIMKLDAHGFVGNVLKWTKNWL